MPNSIALATKYEPILDEVYKAASRSAILDAANSDIKWIGADTVKLPKMSLDGLADYSRNSGFVAGSETLTWGTYQLTHDRGVSYTIDRMDDEETLGWARERRLQSLLVMVSSCTLWMILPLLFQKLTHL